MAQEGGRAIRPLEGADGEWSGMTTPSALSIACCCSVLAVYGLRCGLMIPPTDCLEIDVCLAPEREHDGWSYVDLELDPIRHESGVIQIEDYDEFDVACRDGWITPETARIALDTALAMEAALRKREEPLGDEGWMRLNTRQERTW
jgi:hypothetical protein